MPLHQDAITKKKWTMEVQEENKEIKEEQFDETVQEQKTVRAKTAKEMKAICKPVFQKDPSKYYPTEVFGKYGFTRAICKCGTFYWRRTEAANTCGDSNCVGKYTFIGRGCGYGRKGKRITYAQAWHQYAESMGKQRVPSIPVKRYPIVARWRNDVDFVAAGIFCFQPYCMTGELEPPANPLIQPQFCVRFNDLDNIGLTGRHYSGFVMLGNQVFNYPDKFVYFDEEVIEFHLNWLLDMEIDLDEVTLIEDVWSGGGNLGSSVEIFINGLEVGNMVFTRFKYFPDGTLEELDIKVIDVGIGLERIPWLINGSPTSYCDIFPQTLSFMVNKINIDMGKEIWEKLGPYSCQLNIDEVENIEKTWIQISETIDMPLEEVKKGIIPVKDMYIILDHTRTILLAITDGALPSNVGGGCNIRNMLRRVFAILQKNAWWGPLGGMDGLLEIFENHKRDLFDLYGEFPPYKSFADIIIMEFDRWQTTDVSQKQKLEKLIKKNSTLTDDDWIVAVTSYGIPADQVAMISKQQIPGDLYYKIAQKQEKVVKCEEAILYKTAHLQETENLYYANHKSGQFDAQIIAIFLNIKENNKKNIVILNRSAYYPTSGGQLNDTGYLCIDGLNYYVKNCEKVGKSVLHILEKELPGEVSDYIDKQIQGSVDMERRTILRNHHTGTHIVFAACRQVLGPHIWQNGAKKTLEQAHLDITHFASLTKEQELQIENRANEIILSNKNIKKGFVDKSVAEKEYGFRLYQGGIVPGNTLRVVNIEDTDVEACCGTHCDSTSEVGWVKLLKTARIQDGIVRLYYVAGTKSISKLNLQTRVLNDLTKLLSCAENQVFSQTQKLFDRAKKSEAENIEQKRSILDLRMRLLSNEKKEKTFIRVKDEEPTFYFGMMPNYVKMQQESKTGLIIIGKVMGNGERFLYGQFGTQDTHKSGELLELLKQDNPTASFKRQETKLSFKEGKKKVDVNNIQMFVYYGKVNEEKFIKYLAEKQFTETLF